MCDRVFRVLRPIRCLRACRVIFSRGIVWLASNRPLKISLFRFMTAQKAADREKTECQMEKKVKICKTEASWPSRVSRPLFFLRSPSNESSILFFSPRSPARNLSLISRRAKLPVWQYDFQLSFAANIKAIAATDRTPNVSVMSFIVTDPYKGQKMSRPPKSWRGFQKFVYLGDMYRT